MPVYYEVSASLFYSKIAEIVKAIEADYDVRVFHKGKLIGKLIPMTSEDEYALSFNDPIVPNTAYKSSTVTSNSALNSPSNTIENRVTDMLSPPKKNIKGSYMTWEEFRLQGIEKYGHDFNEDVAREDYEGRYGR